MFHLISKGIQLDKDSDHSLHQFAAEHLPVLVQTMVTGRLLAPPPAEVAVCTRTLAAAPTAAGQVQLGAEQALHVAGRDARVLQPGCGGAPS